MLTAIQIRFMLFLFGCIGSRSAFTALSAFASEKLLKLLGYIALIPVIGWFYIIFIGSRDTGLEVMGEKIWWKNLRPIHMTLWLLFAVFAINGNRNSWKILANDTIFGLGAFLVHHYRAGNLWFS